MADIIGTIYNDVLFGTPENDYMSGLEGDDAVYGFGGNDIILGGAGNDVVVGYQGHDYLSGGDGNDTLGEWFHGEPGSDWLDGGNGNDILYGYGRDTEGTEYDNLTGGEGADKFILGQETTTFVQGYAYYLGSGYTTIHDFKWWEGDKFQAYGSPSNYSLGMSQNFTGSTDVDTGIYYKGDLIAVVKDTTDVILSEDFNFVT